MEPMAACEARVVPATGSPLPSPARRLARGHGCSIQPTRDAVFFATPEGALRRAAINGKVVEVLPGGVLKQGWRVGKKFVYYNVDDTIRRIPLSGGRPFRVHQARWAGTDLTQFALDPWYLYWEEGLLYRKAKDGGSAIEVANVHGPLLHLLVADGYVYYSNGASLGRAPTKGGTPTILLERSSADASAPPPQDRPRLDLPFAERGKYLYGRTEQCGVFRVPKAGGSATILTKGATPRDRYYGCEQGQLLAVGKSVLFEVVTPEDDVLLEVPLAGGEPQELLTAAPRTICAMAAWGTKLLVGTELGIWRIGW